MQRDRILGDQMDLLVVKPPIRRHRLQSIVGEEDQPGLQPPEQQPKQQQAEQGHEQQ